MTDIQLKQLKDNLWHSADLLRQGAHLAANKFGQPILGLVFLRYADILFKQHKADILSEYESLKGGRRGKDHQGNFRRKDRFLYPGVRILRHYQ